MYWSLFSTDSCQGPAKPSTILLLPLTGFCSEFLVHKRSTGVLPMTAL